MYRHPTTRRTHTRLALIGAAYTPACATDDGTARGRVYVWHGSLPGHPKFFFVLPDGTTSGVFARQAGDLSFTDVIRRTVAAMELAEADAHAIVGAISPLRDDERISVSYFEFGVLWRNALNQRRRH